MASNARQQLHHYATTSKWAVKSVVEALSTGPGQQQQFLGRTTITSADGANTCAFVCTGPNKKAASEAAAAAAMARILATGPLSIWGPAQIAAGPAPTAPAPDDKTLTDTVIRALRAAGKEPSFNAYYAQTRSHWSGWIPLSIVLQNVKLLRNWLKQHASQLGFTKNIDGSLSGTHAQHVLALAAQLQQDRDRGVPGYTADGTVQQTPATPPQTFPTQQALQPAPVQEQTQASAAAAAQASPPPSPILELNELAVRLKFPPRPVPAAAPTSTAMATDEATPTTQTTRPSGPYIPQVLHDVHEEEGHLLPDGRVVAVLLHANPQGPAAKHVTIPMRSHLLSEVACVLRDNAGEPAAVADTAAAEVDAETAAAAAAAAKCCGRVISWGQVGIKWPRYDLSRPSITADQANIAPTDKTAQVLGSPSGAAAATASGEGSAVVDAKAQQAPEPTSVLISCEPPHMYSWLPSHVVPKSGVQQQDTEMGMASQAVAATGAALSSMPINWLASWLAGCEVRGDVLMTTCRPSGKAVGGKPQFHWHDFAISDLLLAAGALMPRMRLAIASPLISQLPNTYTTPNAWHGRSPKDLLRDYYERHLKWQLPSATDLTFSRVTWSEVPVLGEGGMKRSATAGSLGQAGGEDEEEAGEVQQLSVGTVVLELAHACFGRFLFAKEPTGGYKVEVEVANNHPATWEAAEQQAALNILHHLQQADTTAVQALLRGSALTTPSGAPSTITPPAPVQVDLPGMGCPLTTSIDLFTAAAPQQQLAAETREEPAYTILHVGLPDSKPVLAGAVAHVSYQVVTTVSVPERLPASLATTNAGAATQGSEVSCLPQKRTWESAIGEGLVPAQATSTEVAAPVSGTGAGTSAEMAGTADTVAGTGTEATAMDVEHHDGIKGHVQPRDVVLESLRKGAYAFQVGTGAVLSAVEAAVLQLKYTGQAMCRLQVPTYGPDPFNILPRYPATLTLTLDRISQPALSPGSQSASLFKPSLGQQRIALATQLLQQIGARSLVDIGCGQGALLLGLIQNGVTCTAPLKQYAGIDISARSVAALHTRLLKQQQQPEQVSGSAVSAVGFERGVGSSGADADMAMRAGELGGEGRGSGAGGEDRGSGMGGEVGLQDHLMPSSEDAGMLAQHDHADMQHGGADQLRPQHDDDGGERTSVGCGVWAQHAAQQYEVPASAAAGMPHVRLMQVNALHASLVEPSGWGALHAPDMAVMAEVVEHLDPAPLSLVGSCLLGGMQPRMLLVTTPNWEYNSVMRQAEKLAMERSGVGVESGGAASVWPGAPDRQGLPMRCSDHRFEWTRAEFQSWAHGVAAQHGYEVEFTGVGRVVNEEECEMGDGEGCGWATQAAVFKRIQGQ